MEISKNNMFVKYYKWIYGELPNDICSLFWGTLLIISLFLIVIPGRKMQKWEPEGVGNCIALGIFFYFILLFISSVGVLPYVIMDFHFKETSWYYILPIVFITGLMIIISIIGSVGYIDKKVEKYRSKNYVENNNSNYFKDFIGSIKGEYCTKIKWK